MFLARSGCRVALFEDKGIASAASGFAFGGIHAKLLPDDSPIGALGQRALQLHLRFAEELPEAVGFSYGFLQKPHVLVAMNEDEAKAMSSVFDDGSSFSRFISPSARWLLKEELLEFEPRLSPIVQGGILSEDSYELDPYRFTLSLWIAAEKLGAKLIAEKVQRPVIRSVGVAGIETASGTMFEADTVIMASGAWSPSLLPMEATISPDISQSLVQPLKGQIVRIATSGRPLRAMFSWGRDYATHKPDGLLWGGTTEERVGFDNAPTTKGQGEILASCVAMFPYLKHYPIRRQTACIRPITPDGNPIISSVPSIPGLFLATGAGRTGISLGPAIGQAVADLALQGALDSGLNIGSLSLERFL